MKIFIDKRGVFSNYIVSGSATGFNVFDQKILQSLYEADSQNPLDLTKATNTANNLITNKTTVHEKAAELFPCIIIIKNRIEEWKKCERKYLRLLLKTKEIYNTIEENERNSGLWPKYNGYIDSEIKRVENLIDILQYYVDKYDKNMKNLFGFFNNSSIWVRIVNWDDEEINAAKKEFEYFENIGLYDYGSAKKVLNTTFAFKT